MTAGARDQVARLRARIRELVTSAGWHLVGEDARRGDRLETLARLREARAVVEATDGGPFAAQLLGQAVVRARLAAAAETLEDLGYADVAEMVRDRLARARSRDG